MIGDFAPRIGFGYMSISASATSADGTTGASSSASFMAIPIGVSWLGLHSAGGHTLDLGLGATILHMGAGGSAFGVDSKSSGSAAATIVLGEAMVGYRYQPLDGGFVFRVGFNPIIGAGTVVPLPYIAVGGVFGA
jgi:hypothetical protein